MKFPDTGLILCAALLLSATSPASAQETTLFADDFDGTLAQWELLQPDHITIVEEPGSTNRVVQLKPKTHHFVHALMRGTESAEGWMWLSRFSSISVFSVRFRIG